MEVVMSRLLFAAAIALALTAPAAAQSNMPHQVSGQTSPWRLSKLIGTAVYNGQNEQIGTISDLLMDPQSRVTTAIISVGGYLGTGDRLVQVPLEVLRFRTEPTTTGSARGEKRWFPDHAILAVTKDTLMGMPAFRY
jgi:sporulation protein YlmC with PRC-barrel domain